MDFLIASVIPLYFLMMPYTFDFFGVIGLGISLYKHKINPLAYSLILALPINIVIVLIYLKFFAKFG